MANQKHLSYLRKGSEEWNAWRKRDVDGIPDLSGETINSLSFGDETICIEQFDFSKVSFSRTKIRGLHFVGVNFAKANFEFAVLEICRFQNCTLSHAGLEDANLSDCLFDATLSDPLETAGTPKAPSDGSGPIALQAQQPVLGATGSIFPLRMPWPIRIGRPVKWTPFVRQPEPRLKV
jgi:hypothetical protein